MNTNNIQNFKDLAFVYNTETIPLEEINSAFFLKELEVFYKKCIAYFENNNTEKVAIPNVNQKSLEVAANNSLLLYLDAIAQGNDKEISINCARATGRNNLIDLLKTAIKN
jgi:hypothetical protein